MAKPIIKIKTGTGKPLDYATTTTNGNVTQTGLTAGELGAIVTAPNYSFYIGNNLGKAITFGNEISADNTLGGASPSDYKLPTQKAVKEFIDGNCFGTSSSIDIVSYYKTSPQTISSLADEQYVTFDTQDFSSGNISPLIFSSNNLFTNISTTETLYFLVTYQITWDWFTLSQAYNSANIIRSAWIQKSGPIDFPAQNYNQIPPAENVYGFTTLLCPPLQNSSVGAASGTQNASAIIELKPLQGFKIGVRNHSNTNSNVISTAQIKPQSGPSTTNFERATRVQIVKL